MRTMAHLSDLTKAHRRVEASVTKTNVDIENFVDLEYIMLTTCIVRVYFVSDVTLDYSSAMSLFNLQDDPPSLLAFPNKSVNEEAQET